MIKRIIYWVNTVCGIISEGLVFLLMIMVTLEIAARHIFNSPIPGQVEMATLTLVLIIYLGLSYTQLEHCHIRVGIFIDKISGKKKDLLEALTLFLSLIPVLLMTWATTNKAIVSVQGGESVTGIVNFPVWPGRCAVAFGFTLLSITFVFQIVEHIISFSVQHRKEREI